MDLGKQINTIRVLNIDEDESSLTSQQLILTKQKIDKECYVVSDVDEELIILVEFKSVIDLHSIKIFALENDNNHQIDISPPKQIHIYNIDNLNKDFDDLKSIKPNKTVKCLPKKLQKGQFINLKKNTIKFKKTRYLAIYIESNQNDTEKTYLNGIMFKGSDDNKIIPSKQSKINIDLEFNRKDVERNKRFTEISTILNEQLDFKHDPIRSTYFLDPYTSTNVADNKQKQSSFKLSDIFNDNNMKENVITISSVPRNDIQETKEKEIIATNKCILSQCQSLRKISILLQKYSHCIMQNNTFDNKVFDDNYNNISNIINDFHHLLEVHATDFEDIYNILIKECNKGKQCIISKCSLYQRNNRDRNALCSNDKKLSAIYLNCDNIKEIINQQILDKIHCHYFHSFDIGYKLSRNKRAKIEQIIDNDDDNKHDKDDDDDINVSDKIALEIHKFITQKHGTRQQGTKFSTQIEEDNENKYSFGYRYFYWDLYKNNTQISDPICWSGRGPTNPGYTLNQLYVHPKYENLKDELINNLLCMLSQKQWDIMVIKAMSHLQTDRYKAYKCNIESPHCYNISKDAVITVYHIMAIMIYCNQDTLQRKFTETYRKMSQNEGIALMVSRHRNFAHLGRLLRELVECFATNKFLSIRLKHQKALFHGITIQTQFATMMAYIKGPVSTTTDYAVAVNFCDNKGMILQIYPNCEYIIDNKILGIRNTANLFECEFISDFSYEQEIFFIGGRGKFIFKSIIIPNGYNYQLYVGVLGLISEFCDSNTAYYIDWIKYKEIYSQLIYRIILHQLHFLYPDNKSYIEYKTMPLYARGLVQRHFASIPVIYLFEDAAPISLMMNSKNSAEEFRALHEFQKQLFKSLFFYDYGWIKLDVLTKLFPSLIHIILKTERKNDKFVENVSIYLSVLSLLKNCVDIKLRNIWITIPETEDIVIKTKTIISPLLTKFEEYNWRIWVDDKSDHNEYRLKMESCEKRPIETNLLRTSYRGFVFDITKDPNLFD